MPPLSLQVPSYSIGRLPPCVLLRLSESLLITLSSSSSGPAGFNLPKLPQTPPPKLHRTPTIPPRFRNIHTTTPSVRIPPSLPPPPLPRSRREKSFLATVTAPLPRFRQQPWVSSISSSDVLSLTESVRDSSTQEAYDKLFSILPSEPCDRIVWERMAVYRALRGSIRRLLERITHDEGATPGLPQPLEFIGQLQNLGMGVRKYYIYLLSTLLARGAPVEQMLPAFEATVMSRISAETLAEVQRDDVERLFEDDYQQHDCQLVYVIYVYLDSLQATSPVLSVIDAHIAHCNVPTSGGVREALRLVRALPLDMLNKLTELAETFKLRHLLKVRSRLIRALERFTETNDIAGLQTLYNSAKALVPSAMKEWTYACFISAFLQFWRSQQIALQVWDDMIATGITPSVNSWNALLRYGQHHDRSALLKIWTKMILVGVVPDVPCWTTRIHSQFRAGLVNDGLESLRLMLASETPPTTATINASIDGLLANDRFEEAFRIVTIADQLGVPANLITYNTLLRGVLKKRGATEVIPRRTLQLPLSPPSPSLQENVTQVFSFMESLEIRANITTYTALIGGLLDAHNFPAVTGVRKVMTERGIQGNADFYTVLIKSAFQRSEFGEVNLLWQELISLNVRRDHILWMETIWGYAQAGLIREMQEALEMMKKEPGPRIVITLKGYVTILRALERRGENMAARRIVEDVVGRWGERGEVRKDGGAARIEEEFWEVVAKFGGRGWMLMLREEVFLGGEEVMGRGKGGVYYRCIDIDIVCV
ncbi:hypothetical protein BDD12DRAFT_875580 [Trichophaea hybrida]|nr:hypothetical protein BDD12DRAFT_875580 [Trichophaea hybrida]